MQARILGAGVAGLTLALTLARRGWAVTLIERGPGDFSATTAAYAGGMLAPACERETADPMIERLGRRSLALWGELGVPVHGGGGTLVVAHPRDRSDLQRFDRLTPAHESKDSAGIAALEPELSGRFRWGLYYPEEAHIDPGEALPALLTACRQAGVDVHVASDPAAWPAPGKDTWVIDCRGLAARDELTDLRGVKGELALLETQEVTLHRTVRLLHPRQSLYIVPRPGGRFLVGATSIESSGDARVTVRSALDLLSAAFTVHPAFGEAGIAALHAAERPAFPDNRPRVIVEPGAGKLWVNGFFRHGWLIAPAVAEAVSAYLAGESADTELIHERDGQRRSA